MKNTPSYVLGPVAGLQTRKSDEQHAWENLKAGIGSLDYRSRSEASLIASLCAFITLKWTRKGLMSSGLHSSEKSEAAVSISGEGLISRF